MSMQKNLGSLPLLVLLLVSIGEAHAFEISSRSISSGMVYHKGARGITERERERERERDMHTLACVSLHTLTIVSLTHTNISIVACTRTISYLAKLTDYQPIIDKHRILISFY